MSADTTATSDPEDRYRELFHALSGRLDEEGRQLLIELDDVVGRRLCEIEEQALNHIVIGWRPEGCSVSGDMVWRETCETTFDPILEAEVERLILDGMASDVPAALEHHRETTRREAVRYAAKRGWALS